MLSSASVRVVLVVALGPARGARVIPFIGTAAKSG